MPHITNYRLDGVRLPSVSTITGVLSKEGLNRWYRKHGFEECDRLSGVARDRGTAVATMFEEYRKTGKKPHSKFHKTVLAEWLKWGEGWKGVTLVPEPHLVNTLDKYHGSPDLVFYDGEKWAVGDDKCKGRFADYGLLMNEHGYAMCNMIHDTETDELKPVPWKVPLDNIFFWTYNPETGKLYPHHHKFDPGVYADFLECRRMWELNKVAEKYFKENAIVLPEESDEAK